MNKKKIKTFQPQTSPIVFLKVSFDRIHQDLNLCLRGYSLKGVITRRTKNRFFFIFTTNCMILVYFYNNPMQTLFCDFRKKGPRSEWTIYKHVSDNSKKSLSVGNSGILSVIVVCVLAPAYISLCRGLEYSTKHRNITVVDPNGDGFSIFETIFLRHLNLVTNLHQTFTEWVSSQYTHFDISTCQM